MLDIDKLFLEFPQLRKGLLSIGISQNEELVALCEAKYESVYDFVGIREAFKASAEEFSRASGIPEDYDKHLAKLEMYMTAHLILLFIYDITQNIDEAPSINQFGKLETDKVNGGRTRAGRITTILNASNIGQRILAMLPINKKNIGGVL